MSGQPSLMERWPTGAVLLLMLTVALLPLGLVLAIVANMSVDDMNEALVSQADQEGLVAAQSIESLLARNALALRVAANGALASGAADPCRATARSTAVAPAVAQRFSIRDSDGRLICSAGGIVPERDDLLVAPGHIVLWVSPRRVIRYRVGLLGGMATGEISAAELRRAALDSTDGLYGLTISDGRANLPIINVPVRTQDGQQPRDRNYAISSNQLRVRTVTAIDRTPLLDRLLLILPLIMWFAAALLSWLLVRRLLLKPVAQLQRAVASYQPDEGGLILPHQTGAASEIRDLSEAFGRAVDRIEGAERAAVEALEGQRRLVREVHHRVKNNLQVVASLLSIHGRSARQAEAKAAYSAIGRRVDALSVVHRHHYAELEENRGISLRSLLTELVADLRSSAPPAARKMQFELDLDSPSTTQDAAVAAAFLITEIVEFSMFEKPDGPIEISLRRQDELTATLAISSAVLGVVEDEADPARVQFERIVEGLARQLRSPLDRKLGRYAVTVPVFPEPRPRSENATSR